MIIGDRYFDYCVSVGVFHEIGLLNKKSDLVIVLSASWKIPATYTIGKLLNLKFAETTGFQTPIGTLRL